MKKKLVVGCGYLGLRIAQKWVEEGDQVYALTRSQERMEILSEEGIQPILANVAEKESLKQLPEVETVLYSLGYDRFSSHSRTEVLIKGLENFLDRMPGTVKQFLFTSSISVYGQSNGEWVDEDSPTEPEKENGRICLEAEELLTDILNQKNQERSQIDWCIFRLAGLYGPGRVFRKLESLKSGDPIGGEPEAWLNLIHVDDADRVIRTRETSDLRDSLLLVSDDLPVTRRDYYRELAVIANAPEPEFDPTLTHQQRGTGLNKRCQNQKIRETLKATLQYPDYRSGLKAIFEES